MAMKDGLKIIPKDDIALVEWDLEGEKVNKLSSAVMMKFQKMIAELKSSNFKAVVMISRKKKIFIAGADIAEIKDLNEPEEAKKAAAGGQQIFAELEDLPIPVIAAVHGACLGGGCEMILSCDYRICTDDMSTKIGLPETKLGIIPGFGGCVRLPRVIGLQGALDIILAGKSVIGKKALKLGLVDQLVPEAILEQQAMKLARKVIDEGAKKRKKRFSPKGAANAFLESFLGRPIVFSQAKKTVMKMSGGHYPAPLKAIEVISKTYGMSNRDLAMDIESTGFGEVAATSVSKNLISLFYMTEDIKKQNGVNDSSVRPRKIKSIGVLGAGTMGGGIAQLAADKGIKARMKDLNTDAIAKGYQAASKIWSSQLKRRRLDKYQLQQKLDLLSGGTTYDGFQTMDVVIEAIVEDMKIKQSVIGETAKHCSDNCIIATNTSSLSVTEMSKGHPKPENFAGMHFFNPVHKMPLVEVIKGEKTSDEVTATVFDLSKKMGKIPVVVKDGPGFLVNRLLLPYLNEAVFLLEEGHSIEFIDKAYLKFGMPMGPLHLIDEIGIDVAVKVAKIFHEAFGERAKPSELMAKVVECGRLGKKNGKGFYHYDERGKKGAIDNSIYADLGLSSPKSGGNAEEAVNRGIFAMVNEAARALIEDKIVDTAREVDLGMIMGTGFPPFRGGLLKHADTVGSSKIVADLEQFSSKIGPRFKAAAPLAQMGQNNGKFYN